MFAKIALLLAALVAVDATVLAPGLLNAGIVGPAAVSTSSVVAIPGAVSSDKRVIGTSGIIGAPLLNSGTTSSVVAIPGAVTSDKRVIGTTGIIGAPLLNSGIIGNGLLANGLIGAPVLSSGIIGNGLLTKGLIGGPILNSGLIGSPLLNGGIISPIGLNGAGILAAPGVVKTIL